MLIGIDSSGNVFSDPYPYPCPSRVHGPERCNRTRARVRARKQDTETGLALLRQPRRRHPPSSSPVPRNRLWVANRAPSSPSTDRPADRSTSAGRKYLGLTITRLAPVFRSRPTSSVPLPLHSSSMPTWANANSQNSLHRVVFAGAHDPVVRAVSLQNPPHRIDKITGKPPVAPSVQVSQGQPVSLDRPQSLPQRG